MIRFYTPEIEETGLLPEVESGHCCRVLRMKDGDIIYTVDGRGNAFECEIINANPKKTEVRIIAKSAEPKHWQPRICLVVAPTKNIDRMEWLLEKATEIGVDEVIFLKCRHSERKEVKDERINKILVASMKQSMKARMPEFQGMVDFKDFIKNLDSAADDIRIMGYCAPEYEKRELTQVYQSGKNVTILIGPEGDFSEDEVKSAVNAGFIPATFGNTRLRTETAALFALCAIHTINLFCGTNSEILTEDSEK